MRSRAGHPHGGRHTRIVALATGVAGFALAFWRSTGVGLVGWDTYPIIASARISSWGDLLGTFTERLTDGRFPGAFYRPVLNVSVALDSALFGTAPFGYQLDSSILFGLSVAALFELTRRIMGRPQSSVAAWAAVAFALAHPAWLEVVPSVARRPDVLCLLFLASAFAVQMQGRPSWRSDMTAGLLSLAAMASKETALIAPVLGFTLGWFEPRSASWRKALASGVRFTAPHVAAALIAGIARVLVLGGLGGHEISDPLRAPGKVLPMLARLGMRIIGSQPAIREPAIVATLVATALLVLCFLLARVADDKDASGERARAIALAAFGAVWIGVVTAAYAVAGSLQPWYVFLPVCGFALVFGAAAELVRFEVSRAGLRRWLGGAAGVALASLLALNIWMSPMVQPYPEWRQATATQDEYLGALTRRIVQAASGATIHAPDLPRWINARTGEPAIEGAAVLADYSVQSWAELRFPDRRIRVVHELVSRPAANEVTLVITTIRRGFE